MKNILKVLISFSFLFMFSAYSVVDTKNANYTKTFVDLEFPDKGIPFKIERTYNSRSLYRGIFGYGWCSNLETKLEVMPDNTIMVIECGGGLEIPYTSGTSKINTSYKIKRIMERVKNTKGLSRKHIAQVHRDLKKSSLLQSELIRALDLKGKAQIGTVYEAIGKQNEIIHFSGNEFKRFLSSGEIQFFDKKGVLLKTVNKTGDWVKIKRKRGTIVKLIDNEGRNLRFQIKKNKVTITGSYNTKITYIIKEDNLTSAQNTKNDIYKYTYDKFHNLKKTCYSDNTCEFIGYNTHKDWVVSFTDRRSCKEKYKFKTNKRNANHYWTTVIKTCGKQVTNSSVYEFWNKKRKNGSKYLYRAKQKVNGYVTDIIYDFDTGSPIRITKGKLTSYYRYYKKGEFKGLLRSTTNVRKKIILSQYDKKCKKPRRLIVQYLQGKKVVQRLNTKIIYHPLKCHLVKATNSLGYWVEVTRDRKGRIRAMQDQSNKKIIVSYNEKHNKPAKITRPGVGSISVFYDESGQIDTNKVTSEPTVAAQITSVFNGFIKIISPVATYISI